MVADPGEYKPWPESLTKYLTKELSKEYTFRYYVLDERAFVGYQPKEVDYAPLPLGKEPGGAAILKSLVRVDFLRAQPPVLTDLQLQRIKASPLCAAI